MGPTLGLILGIIIGVLWLRRTCGVLVFKLPEDQTVMSEAVDGWKYRATLQDLDRRLRDRCKHHGEQWACDAKEMLHETAGDNGVDVWE
jgi:hypothetical protein